MSLGSKFNSALKTVFIFMKTSCGLYMIEKYSNRRITSCALSRHTELVSQSID